MVHHSNSALLITSQCRRIVYFVYKSLPIEAYQLFNLFTQVSFIKHSPGFEAIQKDLLKSVEKESSIVKKEEAHISPKEQISLENITFTYPGIDEPVLDKLNMSIPANSVIGIVGPSGSGKSTLIDVLLGLIEPHQGILKIDDKTINDGNLRSWQNAIGFVSQSIFLSEGTIAENVAFGIPEDEINVEQVLQALKLAHLDELVDSLEKGINTKVGEKEFSSQVVNVNELELQSSILRQKC